MQHAVVSRNLFAALGIVLGGLAYSRGGWRSVAICALVWVVIAFVWRD